MRLCECICFSIVIPCFFWNKYFLSYLALGQKIRWCSVRVSLPLWWEALARMWLSIGFFLRKVILKHAWYWKWSGSTLKINFNRSSQLGTKTSLPGGTVWSCRWNLVKCWCLGPCCCWENPKTIRRYAEWCKGAIKMEPGMICFQSLPQFASSMWKMLTQTYFSRRQGL